MVYQIYNKKPLDNVDYECDIDSERRRQNEENESSEDETTLDAEDSFWDNLPEFCSFCRLFCNNLERKAKELPCMNIICKVN